MKKRPWPFVVGASLAGVAYGLVTKKKKQDLKNNWAKKYVGKWQFKNKNQINILEITSDFHILVNDKKLAGVLEELSQEQLVWQDNFGYHIKILADDKAPVTIYDEADNVTYLLEK